MQKFPIFRLAVTSGAENQRVHQGAGKRGQNPVRCQSVTLFPRGLHIAMIFFSGSKLSQIRGFSETPSSDLL